MYWGAFFVAVGRLQGIEEVINAKFDVERDRLATKSDLNEAKKEVNEVRKDINRVDIRMEQGFKDQLRWLIGFMVGLTSLGIAAAKLL